MYKIAYQEAALHDLKEIVHYIAEASGEPAAAERLAEEIIQAADSLQEMPYRCPLYLPLRPLQKEYRRLFVQRWYLYYWVDEEKKTVMISRVIHGRRRFSE
ncbi:MAG: type II toxin-antitoxin system RelE/ParE family toxin [Erysipelotrichaceae bacterium]|nr:type II toxin-antitoxin system RelE/ParE family toxin [Erysipelotrichaceae bacterium]